MHAGYTVPGVVTGKPISLGGSEGRNEATARGAVYTHRRGGRATSASTCRRRAVAVQGFGNAGSIAARLIADEGATVVAVSDSTGGIHNPDGPRHRPRSSPGSRSTARSRASRAPTDDHERRAARGRLRHPHPGRAREPDHRAQRRHGSRPRSSPRPPTARRRPRPTRSCSRNGVFMIPDILCNAGGVTVSYFEWVQDLNRDHWTETIVNEKLKEIMVKAFHEALDDRRARAGQHADRRLPAGRRARRRRDRDARPLPVRPSRAGGPSPLLAWRALERTVLDVARR